MKFNCNWENYSNEDVGDLNFVIVRNGRTDNECLFPDTNAQHIKSSLERTGMGVIRRVWIKLLLNNYGGDVIKKSQEVIPMQHR